MADKSKTPKGEVVTFETASHPHVHARKDRKLKALKSAFKRATAERIKAMKKHKKKHPGKR